MPEDFRIAGCRTNGACFEARGRAARFFGAFFDGAFDFGITITRCSLSIRGRIHRHAIFLIGNRK